MTLAYHHGANARKRERCRDHKTDRAGVCRRGKLLDLVRLRIGPVGTGLSLALAVDTLVSLAFAAIVFRIGAVFTAIRLSVRARQRSGARTLCVCARGGSVVRSIPVCRTAIGISGIIARVSIGIGRTVRSSRAIRGRTTRSVRARATTRCRAVTGICTAARTRRRRGPRTRIGRRSVRRACRAATRRRRDGTTGSRMLALI